MEAKKAALRRATMLNLFSDKEKLVSKEELTKFSKDDASTNKNAATGLETERETETWKYIKNKLEECFEPGPKRRPARSSKSTPKRGAKVSREQRNLENLKELIELAVSDVVPPSPPSKRAKSLPRKRNAPQIQYKKPDIKVAISQSVKNPIGEITSGQGCLKLSIAARERSYSNAKRYFQYRDLGLDKDKAIAMANRVRCNAEEAKKKLVSDGYEKKDHEVNIENKMTESILLAKKDHMYKIFTNYQETYQNNKPQVASEIAQIYKTEVEKINDTLSSPQKTDSKNLTGKLFNAKRSWSLGHSRMLKANQSVNLTSRWRKLSKDQLQSWRENAEKNISLHIKKEEQHTQELNQKISDKQEFASAKRRNLIENLIERMHTYHEERLEEIRKKEDEETEKMIQTMKAKDEKRRRQVNRALRKKLGRIKRKISPT